MALDDDDVGDMHGDLDSASAVAVGPGAVAVDTEH